MNRQALNLHCLCCKFEWMADLVEYEARPVFRAVDAGVAELEVKLAVRVSVVVYSRPVERRATSLRCPHCKTCRFPS